MWCVSWHLKCDFTFIRYSKLTFNIFLQPKQAMHFKQFLTVALQFCIMVQYIQLKKSALWPSYHLKLSWRNIRFSPKEFTIFTSVHSILLKPDRPARPGGLYSFILLKLHINLALQSMKFEYLKTTKPTTFVLYWACKIWAAAAKW